MTTSILGPHNDSDRPKLRALLRKRLRNTKQARINRGAAMHKSYKLRADKDVSRATMIDTALEETL